MMLRTYISIVICALLPQLVYAQEGLAPLDYNPHAQGKPSRHYASYRITALTLPFFEDFTNYDATPDNSKWMDRQVYINNTMCVDPVSRGVATFDALNQYGKPYDTVNSLALLYADSLTSRTIDLGSYTVGDSLYLSFFYQAQGNGFPPESRDSLLLFFKKKSGINKWIKVWAASDSALKPFRQVMIAITDTSFIDTGFQFRFVNKASIGTNDDIWNLDYIRLDAHRNRYDTVLNDIAFTSTPSFLLKDYTYMPYRQYLANASGERAATIQSAVRNNYASGQTIASYGYTAMETVSSTFLSSGSNVNLNIAAGATAPVSFPAYTATVPIAGIYDKVVFENKFYVSSLSATDNKVNDTIVHEQVFDNYLAYDDGTAEVSFFLKLSVTLPGKLVVEHHLNQADTVRGIAIYFGRQVPTAYYKYLSLVVYRSIAYAGGKDSILYQEDNLHPGYVDTVNHFWIYKFAKPVAVMPGTFYIGTIQPAMSGSDSLYIGFDKNRIGGNHTYYNVLSYWTPSIIPGALMMRPLLGQEISGTGINEISRQVIELTVFPNPARELIRVTSPAAVAYDATYQIRDMSGRVVQSGSCGNDSAPLIDVSHLQQGIYIIEMLSEEIIIRSKPFVKQ